MIRAALLVLILPGAALAAASPQYGPPPAWVTPLPVPHAKTIPHDTALQTLLIDNQVRYGRNADVNYGETAVRIASPDGLKTLASLNFSWNPDTDTVTVNRAEILRDGKSIDLLDGGKNVTVLRRETGLEQAALNGDLTATLQPRGLQVGDVIDFAVTYEHRDPVLKGHSQGFVVPLFVGQASRYFVRDLWPDGKPVRWRATEGLPAPAVSHPPGETAVTLDLRDFLPPRAPTGAPPRYADVGQLQFSDFAAWSDVATLMSPLYAKAAALAPNSPLEAVIEKIRRANPDEKTRAEAALRLTQDQVHYVFLGMNLGDYVPADADLTWSRRFGDCKGKTALLLALLHGLGISAEPVLASTQDGGGLDRRLPNLALFDHVFVRAVVSGKTYWLDATRSGDRDLDEIPIPDFHWVLPLDDRPAKLVELAPTAFAEPQFERIETLDLSGGPDAPAPAHVEDTYRGDGAIYLNSVLDQEGRAAALRGLADYWRSRKPWIDAKTIDYNFDDAREVLTLTLDGTATIPWTKDGDDRDFDVSESNLGFTPNFKRDPGPDADAPYAVAFPDWKRWTVDIKLPKQDAGYSLIGATDDVDRTIAAREYVRRIQRTPSRVAVVTEEKALAPEFPFADASQASADLRQLTAYDLNVQVAPAPVSAPAAQPPPEPTTAAEFDARGATFLRARRFDRAIADFTSAAKLEPAQSKHVYDRGVAYYEMGDDALAAQDFDAALRLNPNDVFALSARADLEVAHAQANAAQKDYDRAVAAAADKQRVLRREYDAYERASLFALNLAVADQGLALANEDPDRAVWLNNRCRTRAELGEQLDQAVDDCTSALRIAPDDPRVLDNLAFVYLKLKRNSDAIRMFDAALKSNPQRPTSLFGRGLAEIAGGDVKAGESDEAAARVQDPEVDAKLNPFARKLAASSLP